MSQVIVTRDKLRDKRVQSASQEQRIAKDDRFQRWRKSDLSKTKDPFKRIVGVLFLPVAISWAIITGGVVLVVRLLGSIFMLLGRMIRGTKTLVEANPPKKKPAA